MALLRIKTTCIRIHGHGRVFILKWHHAFLREKSAAEYFDDLQSVYCCGAISSPKSAVVVPRARPPLGQGFNDSLTIGGRRPE